MRHGIALFLVIDEAFVMRDGDAQSMRLYSYFGMRSIAAIRYIPILRELGSYLCSIDRSHRRVEVFDEPATDFQAQIKSHAYTKQTFFEQ